MKFDLAMLQSDGISVKFRILPDLPVIRYRGLELSPLQQCLLDPLSRR